MNHGRHFDRRALFPAVVSIIILLEAAAFAAPGVISHQGRLTDTAGLPVTTEVNVTFTFWDAETGGAQIGTFSDTDSITPSAGGLFTTMIGDEPGNPIPSNVFDSDNVWLNVSVGGTSLSPRTRMTSVAYALKSLHYQNLIVVAKSGGHYTTISAAILSISDASEANHYLIYVAPGIYNEQVAMKEYVDIEGAGELSTIITRTGNESPYTGTVLGANNAELRFLTVENTGDNVYAAAIFNESNSPRITHVTTRTSGATTANYGIHNRGAASPVVKNSTIIVKGTGTDITNNGIFIGNNATPEIMDCAISVSGGHTNIAMYSMAARMLTLINVTASACGGNNCYVLYNHSTAVIMSNVELSATGGSKHYGIFNIADSGAYTMTINNCRIIGSTNTIRNDAEFTVHVGGSLLSGGPVSLNGGTCVCAGVWDENYTFYASTCP
ncbi:MAG TPA: pectinesterase family protein [Candidatus Sumerlaeota bacterium]|nr:pectinesterase family protein [Candidatus Sumerlaeota bacterium]